MRRPGRRSYYELETMAVARGIHVKFAAVAVFQIIFILKGKQKTLLCLFSVDNIVLARVFFNITAH